MDYITTREEAEIVRRALTMYVAQMQEENQWTEVDRKRDHEARTAIANKLLDRMRIANLFVPKEPPAAI